MRHTALHTIKRLVMLSFMGAVTTTAMQAQEALHLFYKNGAHEKVTITDDTKVEFVKQPYMNAYWTVTDTIHLSASSGRSTNLGNVETNVGFTLSTDDDWLLARKGNLKNNWGDGIYNHYFIVYPTANRGTQSRFGKVTVTSAKGGFTKDFVVEQHPYMLTLDYKHQYSDYEKAVTDTTVVLPWNDTTYYAIAYPNHGVELTGYPEWMELVRKVDGDVYCQFEDIMKVEEAQNAGHDKETFALFRFAPNTTVADRKGEIVFEAQGQRAVINIVHEGLNDNTMMRASRELQQMLYTSFGSAGTGYHNDFGVPSMMLFTESRGMDLVSHDMGYNWFSAPLRYTDINSEGVPTYVYWHTLYNNIDAINRNVNQLKELEDNPYVCSYLAQAYALRAYDYFYLAQMYEQTYVGNEEAMCVPIVTEDNMTQRYTVGIPRATVREVYDYILENLDRAIELLQNNTIAYPDKGFISTAAAYGLRARINLVMNCWEAAAADAQCVIDAGVAQPYTRDEVSRPTFADINDQAWLWGINAEETDAAVTSGIVNWPSHMCTFSYGYAQKGAWRMVSQSLFRAIPSTDVRKGWFLDGKCTSPNLNEEQKAYIQNYGASAYTQVKFAPYNNVLGRESSDINASDIPLMRIEEMYLILAEAKAMMGEVTKGAEVLNSFVANYRDPAYNCTASTAEELVDAVWMQRRIELWGEGHSYYDLMRLKKPVDRRRAGFKASYVFYVPDGDAARIYPIPASEINYYNPALVQNPVADQPIAVDESHSYKSYCSGVFTSGLFGSWNQDMEVAEGDNTVYRLPGYIAEGYDLNFFWDAKTGDLSPIDKTWETGYVHSKYGMLNATCYGIEYDAEAKTFTFQVEYTCTAGTFGTFNETFTVGENNNEAVRRTRLATKKDINAITLEL